MDKKIRLDVLLVEKGFCSSRALAQKLISDGSVKVNGKVSLKASALTADTDNIEILENPLLHYVSRGALKLVTALDSFGITPKGLVCLDIGASTGGFTDVLLQRGAEKVYAIENGSAQLHEKLRFDPRVVSLENTDARNLEGTQVPVCDMAVMDVSFISQTLFYNTLKDYLADGGILISLIKPQFEAGRAHLNKKGIVKSAQVREKVINQVIEEAKKFGFNHLGTVKSSIEGGDGNVEYLAAFKLMKEAII